MTYNAMITKREERFLRIGYEVAMRGWDVISDRMRIVELSESGPYADVSLPPPNEGRYVTEYETIYPWTYSWTEYNNEYHIRMGFGRKSRALVVDLSGISGEEERND